MTMQKVDILKKALEQARQWRCPPHWHSDDWREELLAVAWAALWEGVNNGIRSDAELHRFVVAALMRRYREEWNYGTRWVQTPPQQQEGENGEGETGWDLWDWVSSEAEEEDDRQEIDWSAMVIRQALAQLSEEERYLIERRFWDGATERELAKELGISQPAVHKRLKQIVERLKVMLA